MEPLFKNITIYNSKIYDQFIEFHGKHFSFSYNAYNLIMFILLLYCIILNIIEKNLIFVLLFVALSVFLFLLRIYCPTKRHEETKSEYEDNKENIFDFSFYKNYFTVGEKTVYYFKLYRLFETDEYFYLYIDDENAVLLSKTGFKIGSSEEFAKFMKKKCFLKYRKKVKNLA